MLLIGVIVITVWAGVNLLMGLVVLVNLLFVVPHPLISRIVFTEEELAQLTPKTIATIKTLPASVLMTLLASIGLVLAGLGLW